MAGSQDRLWKERESNTSLAFSKAHLKTSMLVVLSPGCKLKSHERIFRRFNAHSTQRKIYLVWSVVQLLKKALLGCLITCSQVRRGFYSPAPSLFMKSIPSDPIPLPEIQIISGLPLFSIFSISPTNLSTRHGIIREYTEFLLTYVLTVHILNILPASEYNFTSVLLIF